MVRGAIVAQRPPAPGDSSQDSGMCLCLKPANDLEREDWVLDVILVAETKPQIDTTDFPFRLR
jgi:hypothetical protein